MEDPRGLGGVEETLDVSLASNVSHDHVLHPRRIYVPAGGPLLIGTYVARVLRR